MQLSIHPTPEGYTQHTQAPAGERKPAGCRGRSLSWSQQSHGHAAMSQLAGMRCCQLDRALPSLGTTAAHILQAQPGTDELYSQLNYTHPAPLSCLPLPWLHKSTMCTWVFLHASLCFYTPYIWKRNHLFYIRLEMMLRHNWLCSCYQGNPADFD